MGDASEVVHCLGLTNFPRLSELFALSEPLSEQNYFYCLQYGEDADLRRDKAFPFIERELSALDPESWKLLRAKMLKDLKAPHPKRKWEPLFNHLNEAKAYRLLSERGFSKIAFIKEFKKKRAPDLKCMLPIPTLCEVKTVNRSDFEINRYDKKEVAHISDRVSQRIISNIMSNMETAARQMNDFDIDTRYEHMMIQFINFDDFLHEYAFEYMHQIERCIALLAKNRLRVALCCYPPYSGSDYEVDTLINWPILGA